MAITVKGKGPAMHDELTEVDIKKMKEEIDYRSKQLRPKLREDLQVARSYGDLSENFEYKAAKRELSRNEGRIRYLEKMIETAVIITTKSSEDRVGLFDKVELYQEPEGKTKIIRLVTTLRQDVINRFISKESPLGKAIMGHKVGDKVYVKVNDAYGYWVTVKSIEKGEDDETLKISAY